MTNIKSENKRKRVTGKAKHGRSKLDKLLSFPAPKFSKGGGANMCLHYMLWESRQFMAKLP